MTSKHWAEVTLFIQHVTPTGRLDRDNGSLGIRTLIALDSLF